MRKKDKTKRKRRLLKKHHCVNRIKRKKVRRRYSYKPIRRKNKINRIYGVNAIEPKEICTKNIPQRITPILPSENTEQKVKEEKIVKEANTKEDSLKVPQVSTPDNHNKGVEGEQFVNELSSKAYLKYWCYPNPIDEEGDKKEICDLLIAFFETVIIISVKNYNNNGDYERYKKKVVEKSTNQLFGAERKLLKSNRNIKITHPDQREFIFNPADYKHIHRITVNVGEQFEDYELIDTKEGKGSINILNKATFDTITTELDTINDLTEYLSIRESLLLKNKGIQVHCSEKDLLAYYLMNNREFPKECFDGNFEEWTKSCKGKWNTYLSSRSVLLKKMADEKSYFIDELIKTDVLPLEHGEKLAKELMTLSRFERRNIANNLHEMLQKYQGTENDFSRRHHIADNGTLFLYVYYPFKEKSENVDAMLGHAAELYGYKYQPKRVLYLGVTDDFKQWKFGLTEFKDDEFENLSKGQIEFYEKVIAETGWFSNMTMTHVENKEYPDEE